MGLFDFLTGQNRASDSGSESRPRRAEGGGGPAGVPESATPSDFNQAGAGAPAPGDSRAANGADATEHPTEAGGPAGGWPFEDPLPADRGPEQAGWNYGALLEPPPVASPEGRAAPAVGPSDPQKVLELKPRIVDAISTVFDPEIPVNIYELGLIYEVVIDAEAKVLVRMTLTSPACPSAQQLPSEVRYKVKEVPGVTDAFVDVVWEPPWTKDMMSDAAKLSLGIW